MDKYICSVCGYEYDPAKGDPDNGVAPGTAFEDLRIAIDRFMAVDLQPIKIDAPCNVIARVCRVGHFCKA